MSEPALVADTSVLIHFMEGNVEAGDLLLGREMHISVATEIELRTMGAIKRNAKEVITRTVEMSPSGTSVLASKNSAFISEARID